MHERLGREERLVRLHANVETFTRFGTEHSVNTFLLRGIPAGYGTPLVYAGCFPRLYGEKRGLVLVHATRPNIELNPYIQKILDLAVPEHQRRIGIRNDARIRKGIEDIVTAGSLPSFALVIGESTRTRKEVITLHAIVGVSPETALREIQDGMRKGRARLN